MIILLKRYNLVFFILKYYNQLHHYSFLKKFKLSLFSFHLCYLIFILKSSYKRNGVKMPRKLKTIIKKLITKRMYFTDTSSGFLKNFSTYIHEVLHKRIKRLQKDIYFFSRLFLLTVNFEKDDKFKESVFLVGLTHL